MSRPYYPKLDLTALAALKTLRQQLELHAEYLDSPDCPYDKEMADQLRDLLAPKIIEVEKQVIVEKRIEVAARAAEGGGPGPKKVRLKTSGVDLDGISQEIQDLRKELQQLKIDSKGLQTGDKIQIIKTRAALVEKLVSMDERTNHLKKNALFQSTIMTILDDLVSEDRRKEFIRRVEPFAVEETA